MKLSVQGRTAYAYNGGKTFDPSLPCIVFVHGALHDHSCWTLLARWAAHHGHGVLAARRCPMSRRWPAGCWPCSTPPVCRRRRWWATAWAR